MINSTAKKIILSILILAILCGSAFALVGCDNDITLYVEYCLTDQIDPAEICTKGQLLTRPTDPTYVNGIFTDGVVNFTGTHPDNRPFSMKITRVNPGYDIDKNYKFVGWYKEPEYINEWNFDLDRIIVHETSIYAKWEIMS